MSRMRRARWLAGLAGVAALILAVSSCSSSTMVDVAPDTVVEGELDAATVEQMQAVVERSMAATGSTGAVVGVWVPSAGSWVAGFGTSTPGGDPVSTDMVFPIANLTRPMTCDVLLGMASDGLVSLDDPVTKWVRGVPTLEAVTLDRLCNGTSGVGSYAPRLMERWIANPTRTWGPGELIAYGMGNTTGGETGTVFQDSDTAYVLLAQALSKAADRPFDQLLRQYVFDPLDMDSTTLLAPVASGPRLAGLFSNDVDGAVNCAEPLDVTDLSSTAGYSADGVTSTVEDLGRYLRALAQGTRSYDGENRFDDGLPAYPGAPGWYTGGGGALQFGSLVGQFGSFPGVIVGAAADRETGLTVVVALNNSRASGDVGAYTLWQLAAIASKAPGGDSVGLPWTADQFAPAVDQAAICPLP